MEHSAVKELLGVFVLDACDDDEVDAIEAHLVHCAECFDEAARLAELAGWIGVGEGTTPAEPLRAQALREALNERPVDNQFDIELPE